MVKEGRLGIGNWEVGVGEWGVATWNARPHWAKLRGNRFENNGHLYPLALPIEERLEAVLTAMRTGNDTAVAAATHALAGLGHGLTPSGDDILMGVIYALWVHQPTSKWIRLIGETAALRTTTLSAAFLRAAVDGEATIHWHHLTDGRPNAIQNILAIGKTSGREAWLGFVRTVALLRNGTLKG